MNLGELERLGALCKKQHECVLQKARRLQPSGDPALVAWPLRRLTAQCLEDIRNVDMVITLFRQDVVSKDRLADYARILQAKVLLNEKNYELLAVKCNTAFAEVQALPLFRFGVSEYGYSDEMAKTFRNELIGSMIANPEKYRQIERYRYDHELVVRYDLYRFVDTYLPQE